MLSRVAESLYWMARYVERAENVARFLDVTNHLSLDLPGTTESLWEALIAVMADEKPYAERFDAISEANVLHFMVCDTANPNSLISCLRAARENARQVREVITNEMWLQLNTLFHLVRTAADQGLPSVTEALYREIIMGSHLFFGLMSGCLPHNEAYQFAQLGRFIERADKTSRIIDVKYFILLPRPSDVGSPIDANQWRAVLKSVSAYETYWKRRARIEPALVIEFLLAERDFPRAVLFCLIRSRDYLQRVLSDMPEAREREESLEIASRLVHELTATPVNELIGRGLHEYIDQMQRDLNALHSGIAERFF
ncbi:MAG: alpha-E domain-containing protein [Sumerlaeia bacterium]